MVALPEVLRSRSNNASQPVNKLPVEVLRDIFDILTTSSALHSLPVNLPQILAVSSYWRQVALAYPRFWATIEINCNLNQPPAFGRFAAPFLLSDLGRLQEHLLRSRDALLTCHIETDIEGLMFSHNADAVKYLVSLLYTHSSRIQTLTLDISADGEDNPLSGVLVPLPTQLQNLETLAVTIKDDGYEEHASSLLSQGSSIAPVKMSVSGRMITTFDVVDPSRVMDLNVNIWETFGDNEDVYKLLQRASSICRLTMSGGFADYTPSVMRLLMLDGTITRPPLMLPTLKSLVVSHIWVHAPYMVAPSSVEHLAITHERQQRTPRLC